MTTPTDPTPTRITLHNFTSFLISHSLPSFSNLLSLSFSCHFFSSLHPPPLLPIPLPLSSSSPLLFFSSPLLFFSSPLLPPLPFSPPYLSPFSSSLLVSLLTLCAVLSNQPVFKIALITLITSKTHDEEEDEEMDTTEIYQRFIPLLLFLVQKKETSLPVKLCVMVSNYSYINSY